MPRIDCVRGHQSSTSIVISGVNRKSLQWPCGSRQQDNDQESRAAYPRTQAAAALFPGSALIKCDAHIATRRRAVNCGALVFIRAPEKCSFPPIVNEARKTIACADRSPQSVRAATTRNLTSSNEKIPRSAAVSEPGICLFPRAFLHPSVVTQGC